MEAATEQKYNFEVVRWFTVMAVVYLVVGAAVGVYIASELAWPALNFDSPYLSFGRLRPLHTNAVIFAFGGSVLMATAFYTVQRTCAVRLWSDKLAWFTFWGWNLIIVLAVITLPLGISQSKEYAELEWPVDILIAVVWLSYAINFIMTLAIRKTSHIYVSNWFFLGMMVMITYLHVVNSLAVPVGLFKSYSIFSGVQDAMIQWWWGHNAVGFYLTAGFLGIMYYYVPLLGADVRIRLAGRTSPPVHGPAGLDGLPGSGGLASHDHPVMGRRRKRHDDPLGCMGQTAH